MSSGWHAGVVLLCGFKILIFDFRFGMDLGGTARVTCVYGCGLMAGLATLMMVLLSTMLI